MKTLEAEAGENIYGAVKRVQSLTDSYDQSIYLIFNGIQIEVSEDSRVADLALIYNLHLKIRELSGF